jgi:hypothetical protein
MANQVNGVDRTLAYRVLRYTPNLVRDEWVNIGVLVFDPQSGERRMRLIEEPEEYARVRRLHPRADEELLRALRDDLENRFLTATQFFPGNGSGNEKNGSQASADWLKLLGKWDETLSNALQLAPQKGLHGDDLDAETERLYADHVALQRGGTRVGAPGSAGRFARIARRCSSRRGYGSGCRRAFPRRSLRFRATRCALTTATGGTARGDSCRR